MLLSICPSPRWVAVVLALVLVVGGGYALAAGHVGSKEPMGDWYDESWSSLPRPPVVSKDQRRVTVSYRTSSCCAETRTEVTETAARVVVTVRSRDALDVVCPAVESITRVTVELTQPLGDRELVDGTDPLENGATG